MSRLRRRFSCSRLCQASSSLSSGGIHQVLSPGRRIAADEIADEFRKRVAGMMRQIASDEPARHVPSTGECARCVLTADDCSERLVVESGSPGGDRPDGLPISRQAGGSRDARVWPGRALRRRSRAVVR